MEEWSLVNALFNEGIEYLNPQNKLLLRDLIMSLREFQQLNKQLNGGDSLFDLCVPALRYEFIEKHHFIMHAHHRRDFFYFILKGSCGAFSQKKEGVVELEVRLTDELRLHKDSLRKILLKLENQSFFTREEQTSLETGARQAAVKIEQIIAQLPTNNDNDSSRIKEAILSIEDKKLRSRLFHRYFDESIEDLCTFYKDKMQITGDSVDEINIKSRDARYTILTLEPTHLLKISVADYTNIFSNLQTQSIVIQRILRTHFPASLPEETLQLLSHEFRITYYDRNELIYQEGDSNPASFFILLSGVIEIRKAKKDKRRSIAYDKDTSNTGHQSHHSLLIISNTQVFGAECFSHDKQVTHNLPYSAVSTSTETKVLVVDRRKFDAFDHQFDFNRFFTKQANIQLEFYSKRLEQLEEFSQKQLVEAKSLRKSIATQIALSTSPLYSQPITTRIRSSYPSATCIEEQTLTKDEEKKTSSQQQMQQTSSNYHIKQKLKVGGLQISASTEFLKTIQPNKFEFDQNSERERRNNILIGHSISKTLHKRNNLNKSNTNNNNSSNSTSNGNNQNLQLQRTNYVQREGFLPWLDQFGKRKSINPSPTRPQNMAQILNKMATQDSILHDKAYDDQEPQQLATMEKIPSIDLSKKQQLLHFAQSVNLGVVERRVKLIKSQIVNKSEVRISGERSYFLDQSQLNRNHSLGKNNNDSPGRSQLTMNFTRSISNIQLFPMISQTEITPFQNQGTSEINQLSESISTKSNLDRSMNKILLCSSPKKINLISQSFMREPQRSTEPNETSIVQSETTIATMESSLGKSNSGYLMNPKTEIRTKSDFSQRLIYKIPCMLARSQTQLQSAMASPKYCHQTQIRSSQNNPFTNSSKLSQLLKSTEFAFF